MPAHGRSRLYDFVETFVFRFAINEGFTRAQAVPHYLSNEQTSAANLVDQPLTDDVTQRFGKPLPQLRFFIAGEHPEDSADRLGALTVCRVLNTIWPVSQADM